MASGINNTTISNISITAAVPKTIQPDKTAKMISETSLVINKENKATNNSITTTREVKKEAINKVANSLETQLLTDSAMTAIDNICDNRTYTVTNETKQRKNSSSSTSAINTSVPMPDRIEFVTSLLTPDMKVKHKIVQLQIYTLLMCIILCDIENIVQIRVSNKGENRR